MLLVENADKCFVTLAEGSQNALSDGEAYQLEGEDDNRDAVVFSRDDLAFNGTGALSVTSTPDVTTFSFSLLLDRRAFRR